LSSGAERREALVIGNAAYAANPLVNPVNDARAMRDALADLGFRVLYRENADLGAMQEAVHRFNARIGGAVTLFYYAGHGAQVQGRNYLIPVDVDIQAQYQVRYKALDAGYLLDAMQAAGSRLNLVVLDACRDNPFQRRFRTAARGLAVVSAPTGSLVAYATAPGATADDGSSGHGAYTQHLLEAMRTPGLPVERLFKRVRLAVMRDTDGRQVPWESSSLTGDFYFVAGGSLVHAPEPGPDLSSGGLRVTTRPAGAEVLLDGQAKGTVPLTLLLDARPQFGALQVQSEQAGARWYLDGDYMGVTPDTAQRVQPGERRVEVRRPGHHDWVGQVTVRTGETARVQATLRPGRRPGQVFRDRLADGGEGPQMVVIPAGRFRMGDIQGGGHDDEQPVHEVGIPKAFAMGRYEVTFTEYDRFCEATGRSKPEDEGWGRGNRPVINVSWHDALAYAEWLSQQTGKR
jgi:hypothetical protein